MTSSEIKALLCKRYAAPEYATFTEVANGTGAHQAGYADVVAFSLWPSTGHPVYGFEVKVSRGDWLRELKKPAKAGNVMRYCDKWFLVAPKGVASVEEIPKAWGFIEVVNGKCFNRKLAPDLDPDDLPVSFYASLLRRATESTVPRSVLNEMVDEARKEAHARYAKEIEDHKTRADKYREDVIAWEEASGLKVFSEFYRSSRDLGKTVKWVLDGGLKRALDYSLGGASRSLAEILGRLKELEKLRKEFPELEPWRE